LCNCVLINLDVLISDSKLDDQKMQAVMAAVQPAAADGDKEAGEGFKMAIIQQEPLCSLR
jgi:hypothetical protein